mgnify:CR=1 FL=1
MRPLADLVRDKIFILGRFREVLREETRVLLGHYYNQDPSGYYFYLSGKKMLHIFETPRRTHEGRVLLVHKFSFYPSDELVFEVLGQLEEEYILQQNHKTPTATRPYTRFGICYQ